MSSTTHSHTYGWNGINWDKTQQTSTGELKVSIENTDPIQVSGSFSADISGQSVVVSNNSDPATGTKQDTQIAQTLVKDGFSQVLLTSAGGTAVKADTTALVQNDPENREGWNIVNNVSGTKFNFYFFGGANEVITLGQVQSVYWKGFVNVNTEFSSMPFIHIYTKPTGSGDAGAFYHSKITYEYNNDNTIGIGEECVFYGKATPSTLFNNRKVALNNVITEGDGDDGEEVLYMVVASNSIATQDAVNNTINLMGFNTALVKRNLVLATEKTQDISGQSVVVSNNTDPATATKQDTQTSLLSSIDTEAIALNGKISKGNASQIVAGSLQQVLIYGKDSGGDLHTANISNSGDLDVEIADFVKGQTTMASSFPVVMASDQSTLATDPVDTRASSVMFNAQVITDGSSATTSALDMDGYKYLQILGNSTNTLDQVATFEWSVDNVNWYGSQDEYVPQDFNNGDFSFILPNAVARYVRWTKSNTSGSSETITLIAAQRKN
jgi:hypothetical protein